MELETKLPVPDREARRVIEENFRTIEYAINDLYGQIDKLKEKDQEGQNFLKNLYK